MKLLAIFSLFSLVGCETVFYGASGKPVARFQGDMPAGTTFSCTPAGAIYWTAAAVNHSAATLASGTAAAGTISSTGTAAAVAGLNKLIK